MRRSPASGLRVGRWDPLSRRPSSPIPGACRASSRSQPGISHELGSDPRGGAARDTAPVPPSGAPGTVAVPGIVNGGPHE